MSERTERRQNLRRAERLAADDRRELSYVEGPNRQERRAVGHELRRRKRAATRARDKQAKSAGIGTPPEAIAFFMRRNPWARYL